MAVICLTGKGMRDGKLVPRAEWAAAIRKAGHYYTEKATACDILVASRMDTGKAINALGGNSRVQDYAWLDDFLAVGDPFAVARVPDAPIQIDTGNMEDNPLWATF